MLFPSEEFLFVFLPLVFILYFGIFIHFKNGKNVFLLLASLFFYAWGEPKYVYLMIGVILANWLFGMLVDYFREDKGKGKLIIVLMAVVDLGILGFFKYSGFVVRNLEQLLSKDWSFPEIALPIGISFFTFQAMSYVIDVYRGNGEVQTNPLNVGLYISFFPQLIAGPIVRYQTIAEQIKERKENFQDFSKGVCRFIIGLSKKVLIANNVGLVADEAFKLIGNGQYQASVLMAWVGAISYTFQIFFDFAGYSDMAIGLGRMFGFRFEENFKYPYISASVSEFWRRWHISLQTWFRDYVYFPLGGSRVKTRARLVFNLFVVWMLTGIWHGAEWTFFLWGFLYFVLLTVEKLIGFDRKLGWFGHVYTMFFVIIGWVIFRAESLSDMCVYLGAMFGRASGGLVDDGALAFLKQTQVYYLAAIVCSTPLFARLDRKLKQYAWWNIGYVIALAALFVVTLTFIFNQSYNPFIYFNF